eukprot:GHRQ01036663.1.p2 GENE.GHRQ01036663.1~~GHRQ01036663.1.p2  ORF type:complete len:103 (-),score=19.47 GHRQ01036663.1:266-574(-)
MVTKSLPKNTPAREARQPPQQQQEQKVAHAPCWAIPKRQHLLDIIIMKLQRNVQARLRLNGAVAARHAPGWLFATAAGHTIKRQSSTAGLLQAACEKLTPLP